ncbi:NAD(+) synthase [Candidatus Peribacteria bacterium RIFCSPHIGHO2_01_FULL_51_9]|nr:MAG: NAD(+) synthase [Candidatus Peribacteria bacterium RIFCSPHIGHO2_01_FULL_51_9]
MKHAERSQERDIVTSPTVKTRVAVSTLNQWALDFEGNRDRIIESIKQAKEQGAKMRVGSELETTGYSCEDHFLESDTTDLAFDVLADIIESGVTDDIFCVIGVPVMHEGARYNCDAYVLNGTIYGFKAKKHLANDGNYYEPRWFTAWSKDRELEDFILPPRLERLTKQKIVPIGDFVIQTNDTILGSEKCEEMFVPNNPGIDMALDGVEIFANGSDSHWEVGKLQNRVRKIFRTTESSGGIYIYANSVGGDGGRMLKDGSSLIIQNNTVLAQAPQFTLDTVTSTVATANLTAVRSYRSVAGSARVQADKSKSYPRILVPFDMGLEAPTELPTEPVEPIFLTRAEEIAKGPALWMWDYLRRSGASGFFLPLSGGLDSGSVNALVGSMCHMVIDAVQEGNKEVLADIRRIVADEDYIPTDPRELAGRISVTCYMKGPASSGKTESRAAMLAREVGSDHFVADIEPMVREFRETMRKIFGWELRFEHEGGTRAEDLALQNIQARVRMALAYLQAQTYRVSKGRNDNFLLVLGSANVDEANRGYFTKYDCSSADINPIGGLAKKDLRIFAEYAAEKFAYTTLKGIIADKPTAELRPDSPDGHQQTDEEDMGFTYDELGEVASLRKEERLGPVSMFQRLVELWGPHTEKGMSIEAIENKVKYFHVMYAINRHKLTTLTPAVHAVGYSPDDNRFDQRPFLIPKNWSYQFKKIDRLAREYEKDFR